ncbi:endo-1,4-beta-xylanase (plasmid) [Telmatobacter bradus]|uniref:endo-1,4-beta-xylanase n=1 Tax=Telmatobacter bradus TaxID=474953 RepID=UPI003B42D9E2
MLQRQFVILTSVLAAAMAIPAQESTSLKDAYRGDFYIGVALNANQITGTDVHGAQIAVEQFNAISPENVLKWEKVHPQPNSYDFKLADQYVDFGTRHHMFILGHTLVWHSQTPSWVFQNEQGGTISREALLQRLHDHIFTVVGRYKGRIQSWDVVNEALNDDGTLRESKWKQIIGPEYLIYAYRWAHEADPAAELNYNDYNLENPAKRQGALRLIKTLQANGIHIAVVGIQGHDSLTWPSMNLEEQTIEDFAALGVKIAITELDLDVLPSVSQATTADVSYHVESDPKLNPYVHGLPESVQKKLTEQYANLFRVYLKHKNVMSRVTLWGVADADSWRNDWPVQGRTSYPLLFDREDKPKPAFYAVLQVASEVPHK